MVLRSREENFRAVGSIDDRLLNAVESLEVQGCDLLFEKLVDRIPDALLRLSCTEDAKLTPCAFDQESARESPGLGCAAASICNFEAGRLEEELESVREERSECRSLWGVTYYVCVFFPVDNQLLRHHHQAEDVRLP